MHAVDRRELFIFISFMVLIVAIRYSILGDPLVEPDEQFYLLVGNRIWDGAVPFLDIWDRKPVGLFLIYAAFAHIGDGVLAYQIGAMVAVLLTSVIIYRIARTIAPPAGAGLAGAAYIVYLSAFHCFAGQSPVFYNLPIAAAGAALCDLAMARQSGGLRLRGALIMGFVGIALQIKYSVIFEGFYFGVLLIYLSFSARRTWPQIFVDCVIWVMCALAPTIAVMAFYACVGHLSDFAYANFISIFLRHFGDNNWLVSSAKTFLSVSAFVLAIAFSIWRRKGTSGFAMPVPFLLGWGIVSFVGILLMGPYYDHYRAPMLVPLAVLSAPALGRRSWPVLITVLLLGFGLYLAIYRTSHLSGLRGTARQLDHATALIQPSLKTGCLFIVDGDTALYRTTNSCLLTKYIFPGHLTDPGEAGAIGTDPLRELRHIMARHPAVIVRSYRPPSGSDEASLILSGTLKKKYVKGPAFAIGQFDYQIYRLRPELPTGS